MSFGKRPRTVRRQPIRENREIVKRFKASCEGTGWATQAALRKLVHDFLNEPKKLSGTFSAGPMDSYLPGWSEREDSRKALVKLAKKNKLPVSEVIRQIVRIHLKESVDA